MVFMMVFLNTVLAQPEQIKIEMKWELGYTDSYASSPQRWISATVPSAVQLDIAKAEKYEPLFYAENWRNYAWMEDKYYTYRTRFKKPDFKADEKLYFVSKGIDYQFEIFLNDEKIFQQEGMFTCVNVDLTAKLKKENILLIKVFPAPKLHSEPVDRTQASHAAKPAVSYGWDWHPRVVPLGIWDETFLEIRKNSFVKDVYVDYQLNNDFTEAAISLNVTGENLRNTKYAWLLRNNEGNTVAKLDGLNESDCYSAQTTLAKPRLWWTHDHGEPYLYHSEFQLYNSTGEIIQTVTAKIGFRRIRLLLNEGAGIEPEGFPKTRRVNPIQVELNGRKIFCKGTNWVNPEIFPGTLTRERYGKLISLAKEANFNILRVWGGGIVNKESFFDLCDETGILVWQEFPLACNNYPDDDHYLDVLQQESTAIVTRLRKHASLAIWCGGNELFNSWSGMTDQSLALRLLNSQCL